MTSNEEIPKGCVVGNVKDVSIFISVKDHINVDEEVKKLEKKLMGVETLLTN